MIVLSFFFFFNDTATTEIYTLSLHDALPICRRLEDEDRRRRGRRARRARSAGVGERHRRPGDSRDDEVFVLAADRKSTRLNSSHANISYAVFCLKKKKNRSITQSIKKLSLLR